MNGQIAVFSAPCADLEIREYPLPEVGSEDMLIKIRRANICGSDLHFVRHAAEPFGDVEDESGKPAVALIARQVNETKKLHKKWATLRAKNSGLSDPEHPFRYQGSADLNSYKLFVEQAHALSKAGGPSAQGDRAL